MAATEQEPWPLVSLEQACALATHHMWIRVGFSIGVITYGMATLMLQQQTGLAVAPWFALFLGGIIVISWFGLRWHAKAKATMASASVLDDRGVLLGRADKAAKAEIERRARPCTNALVMSIVVSFVINLVTPGPLPWWGGALSLIAALLVWQRGRTVQRRDDAHRRGTSNASGHKTERPRQVVGDDAPFPTPRPRDRRGPAHRRR